MQPTVYALATMDTKGEELCFVADVIRQAGVDVVLVDVSTQGRSERADISAEMIAGSHPGGSKQVLGHTDRGTEGSKESWKSGLWEV